MSVVTLYLHLFAIFAFAGHAYLILTRGRPRWRWGLVAAVIAGAITPLVVLAHGQTAELGWIPKPSVATAWSVLTHLAGGVPFTVVVLVALGWLIGVRRVQLHDDISALVVRDADSSGGARPRGLRDAGPGRALRAGRDPGRRHPVGAGGAREVAHASSQFWWP